MTDDGPKPWERQPGETRKAFHAFCHFRDIPAHERTGNLAFSQHRHTCAPAPGDPSTFPDSLWPATKLWKRWRRDNRWDDRTDRHDVLLAERERQKRADEIVEMNTRQAAIATAMQARVAERLQSMKPADLPVSALATLMDRAASIERLARGQPTAITRAEDQTLNLGRLTDEELAVYDQLTQKAAAPDDKPRQP